MSNICINNPPRTFETHYQQLNALLIANQSLSQSILAIQFRSPLQDGHSRLFRHRFHTSRHVWKNESLKVRSYYSIVVHIQRFLVTNDTADKTNEMNFLKTKMSQIQRFIRENEKKWDYGPSPLATGQAIWKNNGNIERIVVEYDEGGEEKFFSRMRIGYTQMECHSWHQNRININSKQSLRHKWNIEM